MILAYVDSLRPVELIFFLSDICNPQVEEVRITLKMQICRAAVKRKSTGMREINLNIKKSNEVQTC